MRQPQLCSSASDIRLTVSADNADREQRADLARRRRERGDQPAPLGPRAFEQVGDHAGIFAADREPHHAAQARTAATPAAAPICAWVGSSAVASIAADITAIDSSSIGRRPCRSPICPNTTAPTGRIR